MHRTLSNSRKVSKDPRLEELIGAILAKQLMPTLLDQQIIGCLQYTEMVRLKRKPGRHIISGPVC